MATYQELRARSQQVRDEQNIGGNTALRVGQLLMDIVKYFNDNDEAASEYLQQHFAMVNDGTQLLNWQQSPIVILHTMGETYDDGDFSALSQGENYYRAGFVMEANGQGGGINGETPKANVLYVNLANDTLYTWKGASFDAITTGGGGGSISGDDILKNAYYLNGNLVLVFETEGGDKTVTIPVNFDASNYVPTSRTVNGKELSNNITLSQSDIPGLVAALAGKISGIKANGASETLPVVNGIVELPPAGSTISPADAAPQMDGNTASVGSSAKYAREDHVHPKDSTKLSKSDVSVETQGDGTVDINVKDDTYTINLNHTHEGMAKLVKCTEATLPQTMADDTIYVQVDNATTPTEIEALHIFGLEFTGGGGYAPGTPHLVNPTSSQINNGINIGNTTSGVATYSIKIKAKDITQPLIVEWVDGSTGYSFDTTNLPTGVTYDSNTGQLTITVAAATSINGVYIDIVYTGSDTDENAEGTLGISSSSVDGINVELPLIANVVTYEDLAGVKLTGTQWLQTDYYPNANTKIVMTCRFDENSNSNTQGYKGLTFLYCKTYDGKFYRLYNVSANKTNLIHVPQIGSVNLTTNGLPAHDHSVITVDNTTGTLSFAPSGQNPVSVTFTKRTETSPYALEIGRGTHDSSATPDTTLYGKFDLVIYGIEIYDGATKVRNYIPRTRENVPGLYDTINGNFISSETNNELEAVFSNN